MRRVLFHWGVIPIYSYPAMLYIGIVLGVYAELYAALASGLDVVSSLAMTLLLLTIALLGARLLHVLAHWQVYRSRPQTIFQFSNGGASMYGGLVLAVPTSSLVLSVVELPIGAFWDVASFTMLVGMIVTRLGCLLNGCCAGRPSSSRWALTLPDHRGVCYRRVPTQILEAAWGSIVLLGAATIWHRLPFQGALFLYAIGSYGAGRIVLESLRDNPDRVMGVTLHKAISTTFVATSLCAFAIGSLR